LLIGLASAGLSVTLLLVAGGVVQRAVEDRGALAAQTRQPRERAFVVEVGTLDPVTAVPVITAYGHVASGRTLEVRSAVAGPLVALSENFRDGGVIEAGEMLFRTDPMRLQTAVTLAEADQREAVADLAQAQAARALAVLDADAAQTQLTLRAEALARQENLRDRGVATAAELESAQLAHAAAQQTLISRQQAVAAAEARVVQAEIGQTRREVALSEARRALNDATATAPFAGVMTDTTAALGRLVSANERLGVLIDPAALEVAFRVTNAQYGRLLRGDGRLIDAEVSVSVQTGRSSVAVRAVLDRAGAEVGEGQVGRLIHARLIDPDSSVVRPGDFVTVRVSERPLSDVAVIPATALSADERILLIGEGNRLEEQAVTPLRRQDDTVIVSGVPFGRRYVLARALQLGAGIRVEPVAPAPVADAATEPIAEAEPEPEMIALDDARRAALVAFIEGNESMRAETRERVLQELSQPLVPLATVERFEARMAGQ